MAWFFRVMERPGTRWSCRRGRHELDDHADLDAALAHIRVLAGTASPAEVFLHYLDGRVLHLGAPEATWPIHPGSSDRMAGAEPESAWPA